MPRFVCAIIGSRSKKSMEVLSNKEIYVLLKILNDKKLKKGSSTVIEVDKNFSLNELEHIRQEIALVESKTPEEILTIENTYKSMFRMNIHFGYKLNIINFQSFLNYAHKYVQELTQGSLHGLTDDNNLSKLVNEFYSNIKDSSNLDYYVTREMKYMPVILSAYTSNLVELKTITNTKYNIRSGLNEDILCDDLSFTKSSNDTVKITVELNIADFCQRMSECLSSNKQEISIDISSFFGNATIINKEELKKPSKRVLPNKKKEKYHMMPQQWKMLFCLLKRANEIRSCNGEGEIAKQIFVKNGIFTGKNLDGDTPVSRFNDDYNRIMGHKEKEEEMILYSKISDSNYFMFSLSKLRSFYNVIQKNDKLLEEYTKNRHFVAQIID